VSIVKTYDVFCDEPGCPMWAEECSTTTSVREARRGASRAGWFISKKGDFCPEHGGGVKCETCGHTHLPDGMVIIGVEHRYTVPVDYLVGAEHQACCCPPRAGT
jgi:hypothetical protein